jgi:hypothetical protein
MVVRAELYDNHNVYMINMGDKIRYAYSIPYCYPGELMIESNKFVLYEITPEIYVDFMMLKRKGVDYCCRYVFSHFDKPLMKGSELDGFTYVGDTGSHTRPICSKVLQMMIDL